MSCTKSPHFFKKKFLFAENKKWNCYTIVCTAKFSRSLEYQISIQPKRHVKRDDITEHFSHLEQRGSWEVIVFWQDLWCYMNYPLHTNIDPLLSLKQKAKAPSGTKMDDMPLPKPTGGTRTCQPDQALSTASHESFTSALAVSFGWASENSQSEERTDRLGQKNWLNRSEPSGRTIGGQFINFKSGFTFSAV